MLRGLNGGTPVADNDSESLRQFADIIQEKTTRQPDMARPHETGAPDMLAPDQGSAATPIGHWSWKVVAGVAAGTGIGIGYLLGKLRR